MVHLPAVRLTDQDAADVVQLTWLHLLEPLDRIRDPHRLTAEEHAILWQAFLLLSDWCQRVLRELVVDAEDGPPSYRLAAARLQVPTGSLGPIRARCLGQLRKLLDRGGI